MDWSRIYAYDIETYPNAFTCCIVHMGTGARWLFEASERGNQIPHLVDFLWQLRTAECRMLGFNNEHFDYPVLHHAVYTPNADARTLYEKAMAIIEAPRNDWSHNVWASDRIVPQIDMFKIMHFDNFARSTSLKKLEMNMRSGSIEDLPYAPGTVLTRDQLPVLIEYMCHDVNETVKFAKKQARSIEFRDELTERYGRDFTNFNDTKIGKQHFTDQLEQSGIPCYERTNGRRMPRQTPRNGGVVVGERLLPVPFVTDDLKRMWDFFSRAVIPPEQTKGFFKDLSATVNGFQMDFGAGGIHGSVHKRSFYSDDEYAIVDVDVTSYYPSLAIVNRWYPRHLGDAFCDIYARLKAERVTYAKGTAENAMLKLALNGVYGDSNNKHSQFYDPAYTMAITINGQLQLAWLAEMVSQVSQFELIQINTDGLTVRIPRNMRETLDILCKTWMDHTRLELEDVEYKSMHVRDVNNYIAIGVDGKVKRKNAYLTEPDWHQDHSSLVVPKAVDAFVRDGVDPTDFVFAHNDPFDFMRHVKVPRNSRLTHGETVVQNTSRYFIALTGEPLVKVMPPLADQTAERRIAIDKGWNTQVCNRVDQFKWGNLNRRWYVQEAEKLIEGLGL